METIESFFQKYLTTKLVLILAAILSIATWHYSFQHNYVLTYNDAASHLNIARRIVDNYTPGIAQIGTVWLPFPHMLMLIFAWNDFLWKTAIAGSIVSMAAFIISVVYTYKTIFIISNRKLGAFIGAAVIALNPNLLYLQTTPMTETLLISTFVLAVYSLTNYIHSKNRSYLILTAIYVMLSTLIRYDGWFLYAALAALIPIMGFLNKGWKKAEGDLTLFVTMGGVGIGLWVLWNWAIFGDPLYFITGPYSAYAQQQVLESVGQLPTAHNVYNAILYYSWAVIDNNGIVLSAAAIIFMLAIPMFMKNKNYIIVLLAALSPFLFNLIALYIGQSAMNVPQAPNNPGLFNIRYGIMMIPSIALIIGLAVNYIRYSVVLVLCLIIIQSSIFIAEGFPITLVDGLHGLQNTYYTVESSKWLADNYSGGLILTTLASHDAFVARAQIPMRNYIHEGNRNYWEEALKNPSKNIEYIALLVQPPDAVYKQLKNNPDFLKNYDKVHEYYEFKIYKRRQ